ncbi:MAG TPA: hypothetical protein VM076_03315 [Gemmatimonadaceae bacterium]|nr:hypothetical protein [Gemmatimonadaceae bacterium]
MRIPFLLLMFMRTAALVQLVVGIAMWTGRWYSLVDVHRTIGVLFVLALWITAVIALAQRRSAGLAAFGIVWGLLVAAIGFMQQGMLVGDLHWIVRVAHLVVAMASLPIAEKLVAKPVAVA